MSAPDLEGAERALDHAIRIQQEIGARPELARSLVGRARLLERLGRVEEAGQSRARAVSMFREMDMAWDLARAGARAE
jgi:hypothetical protein